MTEARLPLEQVLITAQLHARRQREPDYRAENRALLALARGLAETPKDILGRLGETALELCDADSAGISLLQHREEGEVFYWPAIAGAWSSQIGGQMPKRESPCGLVLESGRPQLFSYPERHYAYLQPIRFAIVEALLSPFTVHGRVVGTIWVLLHDTKRSFDGEHLRRLTSLAQFAAAAYQAAKALEEASAALEERDRASDELRNKASELAEINRRNDRFVSVLAHELRNPLLPIRNGLHILRRLSSMGEVHGVADVMERQVNQLVRLLEDLSDSTRFGRGKMNLRKQTVSAGEAIRNAVEQSRPLLESAHHQLTLELPEEPLSVDVDPDRLTQILANLLNNAAKYTPSGGHVWVRARPQANQLLISVRDDGIGIPNEMLPRVFDLFVQADQSRNRSQGGLGIGLTLVRELVEMHGGSVRAYSAGPGKGSEFIVRLPLADASVEESDVKPASQAANSVSHKVLVVDDNRDGADSVRMLLELLGTETRIAYSGPTALEALAEFPADIVLLDIGMPGMDGFEVARRIRERPEWRHMTLIALTGWGGDEDRRHSERAGFDFHLVKPPDPAQLQELLDSIATRH